MSRCDDKSRGKSDTIAKKKKKKKWEAAQAKECSGFWRWKDKKPPPELMEGASLLTFDCNTQD